MSLQSLDQREVGLKLLWPVISFDPHWCDQYLCCQNTNIDFYTPLIPLHWTVHPWSKKEALENIQRNAWSFLFTQPRGVWSVWCWAGDGQFALFGTFSVSLSFRICSSKVVVVPPTCLACTPIQRGVPSVGGTTRCPLGGGLMGVLSTGFSWGRKGHL